MLRDRLNLAWLQLIGLATATLAASLLLPRGWLADALILLLAAAKGRTIVLDYLGLRGAPALWRGLITAWVVCLAVLAFATAAIRTLV